MFGIDAAVDADARLRFAGSGIGGIAQQVDQRLFQQFGIGTQREMRRDLMTQRDAACLERPAAAAARCLRSASRAPTPAASVQAGSLPRDSVRRNAATRGCVA
ncbi:MAG: hypothetical protein WDO12_00050 [Pseudomonadota bacterium]